MPKKAIRTFIGKHFILLKHIILLLLLLPIMQHKGDPHECASRGQKGVKSKGLQASQVECRLVRTSLVFKPF